MSSLPNPESSNGFWPEPSRRGKRISPSLYPSTPFHQNLDTGLRQNPGIEVVEAGGSIIPIQPPALTTQSRELSRNSSVKILMKRCTKKPPDDSPHPIDTAPEFQDPYSELNLFLSQKIKEGLKETGLIKKWSFYIQEKLIEKIAPEFQRKFPQYRLGISALKKTWEKIVYFSEQMQTQKGAFTREGKLDVDFLIKENLKQYFQFKTPSSPHPHHYAHQLAMKISEYLATIDGVRPMLGHLTKTIWAAQKHLLSGQAAVSPYDEFDKCDKLIVKIMLEITGKNPEISQKELEAQVKEEVQALQELPSFASLDKITANISALLAEKLYPSSPFHSLYPLEQKTAIRNFIQRHISLYKTSTFSPQLTDLVRRTTALYMLACQLPKTLSSQEIQAASSSCFGINEENRPFPQPLYAFISAELLLTNNDTTTLWTAYEEAKQLPPLSSDHLEMIIWKILGEKEKLLEELPYRSGQKIDAEIAHILIDNPHQSFNTIVQRTLEFFRKAKELALSKKWPEIERKIILWTFQGDLLYRSIRLDSENNTLLKLISELSPDQTHAPFIKKVTQTYLGKYPSMAVYTPQVISRISILYKYAWYTLFASPSESSLDRFTKWHARNLSHLDKDQKLAHLEEIFKKTIPLIPFDRAYAQKLLSEENKEVAREKQA